MCTSKFTKFAVPPAEAKGWGSKAFGDKVAHGQRARSSRARRVIARTASESPRARRVTARTASQVGACEDKAKAEKDGPLLASELFCACGPCIRFNFSECEMTRHVGKKMRKLSINGKLVPIDAPRAKGEATRRPQMESLEEWSDELKAGMLVACRASRTERHLEGDYWLAKLVRAAAQPPFARPQPRLIVSAACSGSWGRPSRSR